MCVYIGFNQPIENQTTNSMVWRPFRIHSQFPNLGRGDVHLAQSLLELVRVDLQIIEGLEESRVRGICG